MQDHARPPTGAARPTRPGALDAEREHAAHPRRGGAGGAHRPGATATSARASSSTRCARAGVGERPADGSQGHMPGLDGLARRAARIQHLVVDTEIAWALTVAWRAREALGAGPATADLIADRIISTAEGEFWRWPALRLNQINWYARMYRRRRPWAATGHDLHGQLLRQLQALRRRRARADGRRHGVQPRRRATASTTSRRRPRPQVQPRLRRVREHRLRLPGRLPAGARRRHAARWTRRARRWCARGPSACCRATGRTPAT